MKSLSQPDQFVIACVVVVGLFFLARALFSRLVGGMVDRENAYDDYVLASRQLMARDIRESMAATYSAFATVFFWFVALGGMYSWLLFLIPLFLYVGNSLFIKHVRRYGVPFGNLNTIGTYIRSKSSFKPLHYFSDFVVAVFLFSTLLVEIVIGSAILAAMIPNVPGNQLFFVILLTVVVITYVIIGGFRAVILSDAVQLYLTVGGVLALLVFSLAYIKSPTDGASLLYAPSITVPSLLAFLVSVLAVQLFGPPCQLQNWQRISAAKVQEEAFRAHRQGAVFGAVLWSLMIICALILHVKFQGIVSFKNIFAEMKGSDLFAAYALYPLVFVGLIAAMISTADSAMAALYLFLYDRLKQRRKEFSPTFLHNIAVGIVLFVLILSVYLANQTTVQALAISVIYFLFNQLIVVFPIFFFFLVLGKVQKTEDGKKAVAQIQGKIERNLTLALVIGWISVFSMSTVGYFSGLLNWIMFASASGVAVAWIVSIPSWNKIRKIQRARSLARN